MKRRTFIKLLFIVVIIVGCGSATTKKIQTDVDSSNEEMQQVGGKDSETLKLTTMKLTDKQWLEVKSSYDKLVNAQDEIMSGDDYEGSLYINLSGVATSDDVSLGGMMLYYKLKQQGYQFLSDNEYIKRIKYVFGIDFNHSYALCNNKFKSYKDYIIALIPIPNVDGEDDILSKEFYPYRDHQYFFKKFNICTVQMPSALIIEMDKNTNVNNVTVSKDYFDYHWNNYVLNDNKASLVWLLSNGKEKELKDLLFCFGYDKDDKINELVLNDDNLAVIDKFVGRDVFGKLKIYEGILSFVERFSKENFSDYYVAASTFVEQIAYIPEHESEKQKVYPQMEGMTLKERHKMIAYVVNTLQPLYEKYNGQDGYGYLDKYGIGIVDCFWSAFFDDHELIKDIEANNCYNLPNLTKLIQKMKCDERLVNKQTRILEPWNWAPENYLPDIND
ncbi:hypothetical protein [Bacteroides sp.]